ncbi:MAG TPA: DUF3618 domain-containing protein [Propionibacteriaceae bacterium]|nr:DUF3618 domain-containing protein [Propionibacteriaceae bacterium]
MATTTKDNRSAAQIRADIAAARARMSANIEGLVTEVHPTAVKNRAVDNAKSFAAMEFANAKSQVKDEAGWRLDRLLTVGAAVAGSLAVLLVIRSLVDKSRGRRGA